MKQYFESKKTGRPRKHSTRTIIDAIRYIMRTGCQWRQLPTEIFPPWKTIYSWNRRLKSSGKWEEINDLLVKTVRKAMGKNETPSVGQPVSKNGSKRGSRGYDAGKKIKGRKRHIIVDTLGMINVADVHSASIQDRLDLLVKAKQKAPTLQRFFADQGYCGDLKNKCLLKTGCLLTITKKASDTPGFQVVPKRWIVERTFSWLSNFRRMSKDYEHSPETSKNNIFFNMTTVMLRKLAHP